MGRSAVVVVPPVKPVSVTTFSHALQAQAEPMMPVTVFADEANQTQNIPATAEAVGYPTWPEINSPITLASTQDWSLPEPDLSGFSLPRPTLAAKPLKRSPDPIFQAFDLPKWQLPQVQLPEVVRPVLTLPQVNLPEVKLPIMAMPELPKAKGAASRIKKPGLKFPTIALPGGKTARNWILNGVIAASILILGFIFLPDIYYSVMPADTAPIAVEATSTRNEATATASAQVAQVLLPKDETLPEGEWIIIPRIGVRTQLQGTVEADEALATGVWMAPEYGRPGSLDKPMIVAAHRYGWQWWWKDDYWKYHSFYLLPDLQPGDIVETISDQRKYTYQIYAGEEGDLITDYMADMILYTCKFLNSPVRHIRYAKLVNPDPATQTQVSAVH